MQEFGVWPTWADAMAHCDDKTKEIWTQELMVRGIDVGVRTQAKGKA